MSSNNEIVAVLRQALEALELMYACYAHPEWISHKQQEEKILAQCVATTMTLRQAIARAEGTLEAEKHEVSQEPVGYVSWSYEAVWNGKPPKAESNLYTHPYIGQPRSNHD
jgi:hypothetical protein